MADSQAFEFVCSELERLSQMTRLEARGTVRLALKDAGFSAGEVRPQEMLVVLMKLMPKELVSRGVAAGEEICRKISEASCASRTSRRRRRPRRSSRDWPARADTRSRRAEPRVAGRSAVANQSSAASSARLRPSETGRSPTQFFSSAR